MKLWRQIGAGLLSFAVSLPAVAQTQSSNPELLASTENRGVAIRTVRALAQTDGPAIEIIADKALTPAIRKLENPLRLVIDLPNGRLTANQKRVEFHSSEVQGIRVNQFQASPAVARIVVDLAASVTYSWDAAGNLLTVRLHATQTAAKLPTVPAFTQGIQPAAVPVTSASSGAVLLAGSRVPAGSAVSAGSDTAVLRLGRGGEIRICPQTTVSVTSSQNGHSLMLGMSTGGMEAHYSLDASSDSILTPDFRILLAGPGEFHYGIRANSHGDTCVQALPGNTASLIVSELLGDGTYQVKPTEQISFHAGRIDGAGAAVGENCGCPAPMPQMLQASAGSNLPTAPPASQLSQGLDGSKTGASETASMAASKPNEVHVQVEAPFVFRASDAAQPAPIQEAALLPVRDLPQPARLQTVPLPPPQAKVHHGFFGKIRGFFSSIFG